MTDSKKTVQNIIILVKKIIKEELKMFDIKIRSLVKDEVENHINKILAETFIKQNLLGTNINLQESKLVDFKNSENVEKIKEQRKKIQENLIKEKKAEQIRNLGFEGTGMEDVFADINTESKIMAPGGIVADSDDEGVDLSKFGL
jgi:hypothetical protein